MSDTNTNEHSFHKLISEKPGKINIPSAGSKQRGKAASGKSKAAVLPPPMRLPILLLHDTAVKVPLLQEKIVQTGKPAQEKWMAPLLSINLTWADSQIVGIFGVLWSISVASDASPLAFSVKKMRHLSLLQSVGGRG